MDPCWKNLPTELIRKIIEFSDEIDTRIAFKIPPRKLTIDKNFQFRSEIVYDLSSMTLWDRTHLSLEIEPYWCLRKNILFSQLRPPRTHIFNMEWEEYELTLHAGQDVFGPMTVSNHVVLNKNVKFV